MLDGVEWFSPILFTPIPRISIIQINYSNSLKLATILGQFPLLTSIPVRENSEVVIIYPGMMKYIQVPYKWLSYGLR